MRWNNAINDNSFRFAGRNDHLCRTVHLSLSLYLSGLLKNFTLWLARIESNLFDRTLLLRIWFVCSTSLDGMRWLLFDCILSPMALFRAPSLSICLPLSLPFSLSLSIALSFSPPLSIHTSPHLYLDHLCRFQLCRPSGQRSLPIQIAFF